MEIKKLPTIGIILLFIGVAVAPSINATAIRTIFEKNNSVPSRTLQSDAKRTDSIKHILLFIFVYSIYASRFFRGLILTLISYTNTHSILALRAAWLIVTAMFWNEFWSHMSESRGWNWPQFYSFTSSNYLENQG